MNAFGTSSAIIGVAYLVQVVVGLWGGGAGAGVCSGSDCEQALLFL